MYRRHDLRGQQESVGLQRSSIDAQGRVVGAFADGCVAGSCDASVSEHRFKKRRWRRFCDSPVASACSRRSIQRNLLLRQRL